MDNNNGIIQYQGTSLLPRVKNTIAITDKVLAERNDILIPYRKGKKWGFCNHHKIIIIECIYDEVRPFNCDRAVVCKNKLWGILDRKGCLLCDIVYEKIFSFSEGYAVVYRYIENKRKYGFINLNGEVTIPLIYDEVKKFSEGLAMVELNSRRGFIDYFGNIVIDLNLHSDYGLGDSYYYHREGYVFNEGFCLVSAGFTKFGFINKQGDLVIPFGKYHRAYSFSEGLAAVSKQLPSNNGVENDIWGFINYYDDEVIECKYDSVTSFFEGLAIVMINERSGFIDSKGKQVVPCIYKAAMPFSEGLAAVFGWVSGSRTEPAIYRWGCIDKKGKIVIPFISEGYNDLYSNWPEHPSFSNGLLRMRKNGKVGYLDKSGDFVYPLKFIQGWDFKDNLAWVLTENGPTYIDKNGVEYWED